jgi:hypothetical protein
VRRMGSTGLSLRAEVREEDEPGKDYTSPELRRFFVDLVLVGGGTSVKVVSWELLPTAFGAAPWYVAADLAEDSASLTTFVAEKLAGALPVGPDEDPA